MRNLGFGMMRLPQINTDGSTNIDMEQLCQMVDLFLERGFTYFDTAYMYHNGASEIALKEAVVKRYQRDKFTLTTKLPVMMMEKEEDNERIFQEQLEKCGVEYFDYYMLHCLNEVTYKKVKHLNCFEFITQKKLEGKIGKIGFSYHDNAQILEEILTEHPEVEFVQLQLNYLDWDSSIIQSRKCYEVCKKYHKPVIVMEPIKGGTLAAIPNEAEQLFKNYAPNASIASWAIRFAASHKNVMMVLSGMSDLTQVVDNTTYMQNFKPLNEKENDLISKAVEIINSVITVPCTGCGYCVSRCPKSIPIPNYFALYNAYKRFGRASNSWFYDPIYINLLQSLCNSTSDSWFYYPTYINYGYSRAVDCIECKRCEQACPQHLKVTKFMEDVSIAFDSQLTYGSDRAGKEH